MFFSIGGQGVFQFDWCCSVGDQGVSVCMAFVLVDKECFNVIGVCVGGQ